MKVTLTKIASVTKNAHLSKQVELSENLSVEEGSIIAVEVLDDKRIYNQLELPTGRLSTLKKSDVIAVALGNRSALRGFVGEVPKSLKVGDMMHLLNIGGVAGICTSENFAEVGHALTVKVLGAIVNGQSPLSTKQFSLFEPCESLTSKTPLIIVSGTCMNVGKTQAACEIIKYASASGLNVSATKLAGVACLRDTEKMKDYGATEAVSFLDAGLTSTAKNEDISVQVTKGAINYLSQFNQDYIVVEFGDGVIGEYGVKAILSDKQIQKNVVAHIGCANDLMGASKLADMCQEIGMPLDVISGPTTDNSVGINFIEEHLALPACNAKVNGKELFELIQKKCLK